MRCLNCGEDNRDKRWVAAITAAQLFVVIIVTAGGSYLIGAFHALEMAGAQDAVLPSPWAVASLIALAGASVPLTAAVLFITTAAPKDPARFRRLVRDE